MSRTRLPETPLAALATAVVAWPLTTLFTPDTWVRPTMAMIAVVAVAGLVGRRLTASSVGIIAIQLVAVVLAAGGLYGRGHLWHGLPTIDMVLAFNNLLVDARETVQSYSAPAPTNRGIILGIGLAIALTAILVDHLAVMRRSPALAGLPLLTAFLISASNSGSSLHPVFFLIAAGVWLVMVGRQGTASLRRWSTTTPLATEGRRRDDHDGTFGFAALGRTLAVGALAAAVVLPGVLPHLPTRYLVDGLGQVQRRHGLQRRPARAQHDPRPRAQPQRPVTVADPVVHHDGGLPHPVARRRPHLLPRRRVGARPRPGRLQPAARGAAARRS